MPRDIIRRLARDAERVLVAGAHLAASDAGLAASCAALDGLAQQLGAKAPAIVQLSAAAGRMAAARGKDAARELVGLVTMSAQIRAAQAQPAAVTAHQPLPPTPRLGTPCNAKGLTELHQALVQRGKGRQQILEAAIESGDIADLRLVDAVIFAMGDAYIGELVTRQAIPRLGPAIISPIRAVLNLSEPTLNDGRRLRALVAVQRGAARDLVTTALASGNAQLREAAFTAIAEHVPGDPEFEPITLAAVQKEKSRGVRRAGLLALAGLASDAAFTALTTIAEAAFAKLKRSDTAKEDDSLTLEAALVGIAASRHAQAIDWLLARLAEATHHLAQVRARVEAKGAIMSPGERPESIEMAVRLGETVLKALSLQQSRSARIAAAALPLMGEFGKWAALAVVANGDTKQIESVADLLGGDDPALYAVAVAAVQRLGAEAVYERFTAVFKVEDRKDYASRKRLAEIVESLEELADPRWPDFCLRKLAEPNVAVYALPLLGRLKERRAIAPVSKLLRGDYDYDLRLKAVDAMGQFGDASVIDLLITLIEDSHVSERERIIQSVLTLSEPATVDAVRARLASRDLTERLREQLERLSMLLEQRYPGR